MFLYIVPCCLETAGSTVSARYWNLLYLTLSSTSTLSPLTVSGTLKLIATPNLQLHPIIPSSHYHIIPTTNRKGSNATGQAHQPHAPHRPPATPTPVPPRPCPTSEPSFLLSNMRYMRYMRSSPCHATFPFFSLLSVSSTAFSDLVTSRHCSLFMNILVYNSLYKYPQLPPSKSFDVVYLFLKLSFLFYL